MQFQESLWNIADAHSPSMQLLANYVNPGCPFISTIQYKYVAIAGVYFITCTSCVTSGSDSEASYSMFYQPPLSLPSPPSCFHSEQKLIRQKVDVVPISATVEAEDGLRVPVKLLDCDSISQAKEKLLDSMHKAAPVSKRPKLTEVDLGKCDMTICTVHRIRSIDYIMP